MLDLCFNAARRIVLIVVVAGVLNWAASLQAGGGPENVLLVANPLSRTSLTIANHYVHLRHIPPSNVVLLPWEPTADKTDIETFRRQILVPILKAIETRRLTGQIDYVVYSSDYPWGIDLGSDFGKFTEQMRHAAEAAKRIDSPDGKPDDKTKQAPPPTAIPQVITPVGSINGLTYMWQAVLSSQPAYLSLDGNWYMRQPAGGQLSNATAIGFRSDRLYDAHGAVVTDKGRRYFLSVMLGVTAGRGNSLDEILRYLKRSAAADGTQPKGTIYFVENDDVRSKVRHALVPTAASKLRQLGVAAEILQGTVPLDRQDVQGLLLGTAGFDWKTTGSAIRPGAICEHFTSFGGVMSKDAGQTPLSELLRFGAAGASGTVAEPYAIPNKFPSPMIQVYYACGCTLAEAFYQSVYGPYQLLIVGDPLCRPWAKIPKVSVSGVEPGATVKGRLTVKPTAALVGAAPVTAAADHFELFVDGVRMANCPPAGSLAFDSTALADGYHELRVVAIGPKPIETQGRAMIPFQVNNHNRTIEASLVAGQTLRLETPITVSASSPGSRGIIFAFGSHVVAQIAGEKGQVAIPAGVLGAGPVSLRVAGLGSGGPATCVMAKPIEFVVR